MAARDSRSSRRDFIAATASASLVTPGLAAASTIDSKGSETMAQEELRKQLVTCLGGPWPDPCPLNATMHEATEHETHRTELWSYEVELGDRVSAYLLIPKTLSQNRPAPGIAIWHQHNGQYNLGKSEPAGLDGNPMHHTGVELAKEGYVVVCPDALCFEERQDPDQKLKGMSYERFEFLRYVLLGKSMAWKNILDMRRAIDFLTARPEVKSDSIGCYGHSMGSTHVWLVGPHDTRIKAMVGNCCLPTYSAITDHKLLHCFPNFVPGWWQYGDTPEIASLIAPRALHLNLGENDGGSPIDHAKLGIKRIAAAYGDNGASQQFSSFVEKDTGHVLSDAMWEHTRDVFARHLKQ